MKEWLLVTLMPHGDRLYPSSFIQQFNDFVFCEQMQNIEAAKHALEFPTADYYSVCITAINYLSLFQ